jgi:hypothetical protein
MAGVLYSAQWDCAKCGLRLRGFFKEKDVLGAHFVDHAVDCPGCGETSKDLVAKPYRLDKQIGEHNWETVWEKMA